MLRPFLALLLVASAVTASAAPSLRALIIDGQNNHDVWPKSTFMMKHYLEETGLFSVDIERTAYTWRGAKWLPDYPLASHPQTQELEETKTDPDFSPDFSDYDVVICNFGWMTAPWPEATRTALESYVSDGGGFVSVHAADNAFPEWRAYNEMIGLGGWGDRDEKDGPYVYYDNRGELVRDDSPGRGGSHGPQHHFTVDVREPDHPITRGMPSPWAHTLDELYDRLRGPALNMTVLATAYSAPDERGTDRHEPVLMVIEHGEGRVFHTTIGHDDYSQESVGFIVSFQRGTEWAASGEVTQPIPADFPGPTQATSRPFDGP